MCGDFSDQNGAFSEVFGEGLEGGGEGEIDDDFAGGLAAAAARQGDGDWRWGGRLGDMGEFRRGGGEGGWVIWVS